MLTSRLATRVAIALVAVGVGVEAQAQKAQLQSVGRKSRCSAMAGYVVPAARIALSTRGATIKVANSKHVRPTGNTRVLA